jgi:hypothetical protein
MQFMAYYHHMGFGEHILDMIVRGFVYRTISVLTRGWGIMPMLLVTAAVIGVAYLFSRRRA